MTGADANAISGPICITGATGFLGSWAVKEALDAGFEVHATTRSEGKAGVLKSLDGAKERLKLFTGCDLMKKGSFDEAISGCPIVLHTASPVFFSDNEDDRSKLVDPAVQGTQTVLEACAAAGVKKVVLTSSTAAVYMAYGRKPAEEPFTEKDFSPQDVLEEKKNYYALSKLLAERAAWEIAERDGCPFKLSVMNPTYIFGPVMQGQKPDNVTAKMVSGFFKAESITQISVPLVDVRDVAKAHVLAAKMDLDWAGWGRRFLLVGATPMQEEIIKVLRDAKTVSATHKNLLPTTLDPSIPPAVAGHVPPARTKMDVSPSTAPPAEGGLSLEYHHMYETVVDTYATADVDANLQNAAA
ncbi:Dihydroflavonol 4-reductase [Hondaea fermentalgiana]|uniref:Dihydroflavonol 4-reductase n=1 Tax=Hondaea fermentalgiana TaxID=2315210 RepID=A0A2R5GH81_9STRA|nr:Dihydroflavonol 4-reductase [Hondaea fermentalgiana]|eukprot:GBG29945.1 Dihydroflavonol 4-reductase [Hondaea fermentalgiana]